MFKVIENGENRLDIEMNGKLDAECHSMITTPLLGPYHAQY